MAKERSRTKTADSVRQVEVAKTDRTHEIANLAYRLWLERGCPDGTPEEDWFRAEQQIQTGSSTIN